MKSTIFFFCLLLIWAGCQHSAPESAIGEAPERQSEETAPTPPIDTALYPLTDGYYRIDWNLLGKVEFEQKWHDTLNDYIYFPVFHPEIRAFEGKPVEIGGYVIPFEETQDERLLVLSAFPFSSCFFCGGAGPESVMDIQLDQSKPGSRRTWKQDAQISFRGSLRLNDSDVYFLNYILEEAFPAP
ncbi:MAG: hypothetical protein WA004_09445 [Saprospiraceae bacterium]